MSYPFRPQSTPDELTRRLAGVLFDLATKAGLNVKVTIEDGRATTKTKQAA